MIVGDRTSVTREKRVIWADFLGAPAPFPLGPFVLSSVLGCPVYLMFGLKEQGRFRVHFEPFADGQPCHGRGASRFLRPACRPMPIACSITACRPRWTGSTF